MPARSLRLAYIDWLRGLACLLMFQTHCYDAWLGGAARNSKFVVWSQLGGTFPAPLFLFLAGISFALTFDKLLAKGPSIAEIGKVTIRRGAEIFALGLLFRVQEFGISYRWAPWTDLFRVDILNNIGVSIMLMGVMCWAVLLLRGNSRRNTFPWAALITAAAISALTPMLWATWRPRFLPWELESYVNGVHNLDAPQPWLFPIFPWSAFAFAGLAFGFVLVCEQADNLRARILCLTAIAALALIYFAKFLDSRQFQLYPVFDFWHSSPEFFMIRVGLLSLLTLCAYSWCRWGPGQVGFSPLIQLGKTSLLVYWAHIEFVYGRFTILPHHSQTIAGASRGLAIIFSAMVLLSLLRTYFKNASRGSCSLPVVDVKSPAKRGLR